MKTSTSGKIDTCVNLGQVVIIDLVILPQLVNIVAAATIQNIIGFSDQSVIGASCDLFTVTGNLLPGVIVIVVASPELTIIIPTSTIDLAVRGQIDGKRGTPSHLNDIVGEFAP